MNGPLALRPGDRLGGYALSSLVARGGMGAVWLARRNRRERPVALKTLLPELASDPVFAAMLREEARIASRIDHPNVARVVGWGEEGGTPFLATEWVEGVSALALHTAACRRTAHPMPLGIAMRIVVDACAGLQAAHDLADESGQRVGLVHRDVSPPNLIVGRSGATKLIDFGIAKVHARAIAPTANGFIKGKVPFMSPEQALGRAVDLRSDLWSVAATLFYLLSGLLPIDAPDDVARLHRLVSRVPPRRLDAAVPSSVAAIVATGLAYDPVDRFESAEQMRASLMATGYVASNDDVAAFVDAHAPAPTPERRVPRRALGLAFAAVAMGVGWRLVAHAAAANSSEASLPAPAGSMFATTPPVGAAVADAPPSPPAGSAGAAPISSAVHDRQPPRPSDGHARAVRTRTSGAPPAPAARRDYGF